MYARVYIFIYLFIYKIYRVWWFSYKKGKKVEFRGELREGVNINMGRSVGWNEADRPGDKNLQYSAWVGFAPGMGKLEVFWVRGVSFWVRFVPWVCAWVSHGVENFRLIEGRCCVVWRNVVYLGY